MEPLAGTSTKSQAPQTHELRAADNNNCCDDDDDGGGGGGGADDSTTKSFQLVIVESARDHGRSGNIGGEGGAQ